MRLRGATTIPDFDDVGLHLPVDRIVGRFEGEQALVTMPEGAFELPFLDNVGGVLSYKAETTERAVVPTINVLPALDPLHRGCRPGAC